MLNELQPLLANCHGANEAALVPEVQTQFFERQLCALISVSEPLLAISEQIWN
jgi:hypothetical protein